MRAGRQRKAANKTPSIAQTRAATDRHLQHDVLRQLPVERVVFREPPEQKLAERPQRRHGVLHLRTGELQQVEIRSSAVSSAPPFMTRRGRGQCVRAKSMPDHSTTLDLFLRRSVDCKRTEPVAPGLNVTSGSYSQK